VHPMSPLTKLVWFGSHEKELFGKANRWVGSKDWILWRMTGELVTDHSLGSASGLMDIHGLAWDDEALEIAGISSDRLPDLVPTTHVIRGLSGDAVAATGLRSDTPIVVGAGDGPLANLGVGAVRSGVAA